MAGMLALHPARKQIYLLTDELESLADTVRLSILGGYMLYTGKMFGLPLPDEYQEYCRDHLQGASSLRDGSVVSRYENKNGKAMFHTPTIQAVAIYEAIREGAGAIGYSYDDTGAKNMMLVEYDLPDGRRVAMSYHLRTGNYRISIASFINDRVSFVPYPVLAGTNNGFGLTGEALVIPFLHLPNEEKDLLLQNYESVAAFEDKARCMLALCSNVYARINRNQMDTGRYSVNNTGNITVFRDDSFESSDFLVKEGIGEFKVFKSNLSLFHTGLPISRIDRFHMGIMLSEKEKALVPKLPDTFDVPDQAYEMCTMIKSCGMRKFLLRGKSGVGKTTIAPIVAQLLGLPYRFFNCSGGTDEMQLVSNFVPVSAGEVTFQIPSYMDLVNDPATAWYKLTGEYDEDATGQDVLDRLVQMSKESAGGFKLVESSIVTACRYPSVIEIQEPSAIRNPTAIEALNSLLDGNQSITTVDGEVVHCDPNTIFILTTNPQYQGNKELTQAVLDRMNMIFEMGNPAAEVMALRAMKVTGYTDRLTAIKMAEVILDIDKYCDINGIVGGVCGPRAYENWLRHTMITGNPLKSVDFTVLTKAVLDPEIRSEVRKVCVESKIAA